MACAPSARARARSGGAGRAGRTGPCTPRRGFGPRRPFAGGPPPVRGGVSPGVRAPRCLRGAARRSSRLTIGCDGSNSIRRRGPEFRRGLPAYSIQNVCSSATWPASARAPVEGRWTASTNTVYLSSSSPLRQLVNPGDGPVGPAGKGKTHGRQGDGCDSASAEDGQDQGSRPTRVVSRRSSPTSSWPGGGARRRACGRACATSPLSLAPPTSDVKATRGKWARQDSNLRPGDYESLALTN